MKALFLKAISSKKAFFGILVYMAIVVISSFMEDCPGLVAILLIGIAMTGLHLFFDEFFRVYFKHRKNKRLG